VNEVQLINKYHIRKKT